MRRIALLIPLLLVAGACGSPEGSAGAEPGSPPSRSYDPETPVTSRPGTPGKDDEGGPGYDLVHPKPGMHDIQTVPFARVKSENDSNTLIVIFWSGVEPCNVLDRVEIEETARDVTITLYEGSDPQMGDAACIELAVKKAVEVELEEPLGDRKVLDGAG
jgi:hypothetical protein